MKWASVQCHPPLESRPSFSVILNWTILRVEEPLNNRDRGYERVLRLRYAQDERG